MAKENLQNPLGWVKDSVLTEEILKCLDSKQRNPTMYIRFPCRGHGGDYPRSLFFG